MEVPTESSLLEQLSVVIARESSLLEPRSNCAFPVFQGIKIEKEVVDSGQATVYIGVHESSKTRVAVKVLHLKDPNAKAAYREELETLMMLRHPNILRVISTFEKPQECIVTKWMEGGPLNEWLANQRKIGRGQPISWERGRRIALDIASGLAYLHSEGKVHRDLKSMNVFMDQDGTAVLADFGFAKSVDVQKVSLQMATFQMGTIHWMSPEMIRDQQYSFASDVYAFGIIVWEILSSEIPYAEFTKKRQLEDAVLAGERPPVQATWPSEACDLMMHCWASDPCSRLKAASVVEILSIGLIDGQIADAAKALFPADLKQQHTLRGSEIPMIDFVGVREKILEVIERVRGVSNVGGENRRILRGHVDLLKRLEELIIVLCNEGSRVWTPYCAFLFRHFEADLVSTGHVLELWENCSTSISSRENVSRVQDMLQGMKEWWLRIGLVLQGTEQAKDVRAGTFTGYSVVQNEEARMFWIDHFPGRSEVSWGEFRNTLLAEVFLSQLEDAQVSQMLFWSKVELQGDGLPDVLISKWEEFSKAGHWKEKLLNLAKKTIQNDSVVIATDSSLERMGISLGGSGLSSSRIQLVELAFLVDCTSTMGKHLDDLVKAAPLVVQKAKEMIPLAFLRVAFVGYRDIGDKNRLCVLPFTEEEEKLISFIKLEGQPGGGGGDASEDVLGGLERAVGLEWSFGSSTVRRLVHIADAPGHGLIYHNFAKRTKAPSWAENPKKWDRFPGCDTDGAIGQQLMARLSKNKIDYTFVQISSHTRKMTTLLKQWYDQSPAKNLPMNVVELGDMESLILRELGQSFESCTK